MTYLYTKHSIMLCVLRHSTLH